MNTTTWTITQPCGFGTGSNVSLPVFGAGALLPTVEAGTAGHAARERRSAETDAAMAFVTADKPTPGTHVWSPPT